MRRNELGAYMQSKSPPGGDVTQRRHFTISYIHLGSFSEMQVVLLRGVLGYIIILALVSKWLAYGKDAPTILDWLGSFKTRKPPGRVNRERSVGDRLGYTTIKQSHQWTRCKR